MSERKGTNKAHGIGGLQEACKGRDLHPSQPRLLSLWWTFQTAPFSARRRDAGLNLMLPRESSQTTAMASGALDSLPEVSGIPTWKNADQH